MGIAMMKRRMGGTWIAPGVYVKWTPEVLRTSLAKVATRPYKLTVGEKSWQAMRILLPGRRFKRIILGKPEIGIPPKEGAGFIREVGLVMGSEGTMDLVRYVNKDKQACFDVFLDIPEGELREERIADLIDAAENIAKLSGIEYLHLDTPCGEKGKITDEALESACDKHGWAKFQTMRGKKRRLWARFGIYLVKHKKKPKVRN
ncbi:MAG: hypothetical protein V1676_06285 [Candidatus Diapherotrites archaeon]